MLLQTVSRGHAQRAWATAFLLLPLASIVWGQQPDTPRRPKVTIHVVTPPPPPADTPLVHHVAPDAPLLVELNQKTQLAKAETVFVFSRGFPDVYEGQPIDRRFYDVLQPFYGELAFPMKEPEVFATYRVALGDTRTGYLLRVPGMYQPSAIDLWVYDSRMVRFEPPLQLAEAYGDAGAEYELSGWLVDLDGDGRLDVVLRQQTSYTRMETDSLISQSDSLWIVSWANGVRTRHGGGGRGAVQKTPMALGSSGRWQTIMRRAATCHTCTSPPKTFPQALTLERCQQTPFAAVT